MWLNLRDLIIFQEHYGQSERKTDHRYRVAMRLKIIHQVG